MSGWAARTASMYVPILFAVSPFAAIRSAPVSTASTSPEAIMCAAAESAITGCGLPAAPPPPAVTLPCAPGRAPAPPAHLLERPGQVDRGRARRREHGGGRLQ